MPEGTFINESLLPSEIHKTPDDYLIQELRDDISVFSKKRKNVVLKKLNGEKLQSAESKVYIQAVNDWWKDKYGFSFGKKDARNEVLVRKYAPEAEIQAGKDLQVRLFDAVKEGDEERIDKIKKEYLETYPDQLEGIEVLFGIRDIMKKQKEFDEKGKEWDKEKKLDRFKDFTEYQFLFTHFILLNSNDKKFMDTFWKASFAIADRLESVREFNILKRSLISQVAVYKIIEAIEGGPKLSHPNEDAFHAIDLWTESGQAIQIKGWNEETPAVIEADAITFPSINTDSSQKSSFFNSMEYFKAKSSIFQTKIEDYGRRIGKKISGYMLAVPYSKIDFTTGEPAPELIEFFKKEIKGNLPV